MGRPLWGSSLYAKLDIHRAQFTRGSTSGVIWRAMEDMIELGAGKLLAGQYMWSDRSYSEASMFGVAAMFCRLGVQFERGYVRAPFLVSDLMATLSCTSRDGTKELVGYPSDPMLALSAAHVWYGFEYDSEGCPLTKYILPQFQKHLNRLDLEVMSASELVARIVLLLAMDACVVTKTGSQQYPFRGQFVDVTLFIQALGGGTQAPLSKSTMATAAEATRTTILEAWHAKWSGWKCGFCQFVEMHDEPTEDLLWVLLGRRAAGIFLGDGGSADLLVPMFNGEEVSFLSVQVEGAKERENDFPVCVMEEMQPTRVFSDSNPLHGKAPGDIIRVYMNLNESASLEKPDKFFVYDGNERIQVAGLGEESKVSEVAAFAALTLCIHSLRPWTLPVDEKSFPVVTETVSTMLTRMVETQTWSQLMKSYGRDVKKPTESPFNTQKKSPLGPLIMSDDARLELISQMAQTSNSSCGVGADQS